MNAVLVVWVALWAGEARADKLVRCEASLERSVGAVAVPGWGPDEDTARRRAREAAWHLAWADRWPGLAAGMVGAPADTERREAALREQLDPNTDWLVPGAVVRPGECEVQTVTAAKGEAWAARWEREDRKVIRADPSVAIEAARRRQCWGSWSHRMIKAAQLGSEATEERYAATYPGARAATDGLFRCMTRGLPDLQPAGGPIEGIADPGPVQCARPRRLDGRWTAGPAWAADLESAREAALQLDLGTQLRRMEASLTRISAPDASARAPQVEAAALADLGGLVVATDLAEQALLSCATAAPKSARPTWTLPEGLTCAGWPTGPGNPTPATALEGAREARCAPAFRQAAVRGSWPDALRCSASCRTDTVADGWHGKSVWRPAEPARGSVEDAEKLLSAALAGKDFHLLGIATGGLIFEARFAAAFKADPTAFWGSIEQARTSGSWKDLAYWEQVSGSWVLAFKDAR